MRPKTNFERKPPPRNPNALSVVFRKNENPGPGHYKEENLFRPDTI